MIELFKRWKTYMELSHASEIIRRYFCMNFFDGVLTALGLIIGFFLSTQTGISVYRTQIVGISISTAIAIGVSGFTGSSLTEMAERRIKLIEIEKAMAHFDDENENENENENE